MGKKKSKTGKKPRNDGAYVESKEFHDGLELEGADAYEAMQDEKISSKMSKLKNRNKFPDVSGGVDELYALSGDSDSDDFDAEEGIEFADGDEENEDDVRAWGNKKKHFYGGNPNDKYQNNDKVDKNELDEAEAEEAEGKLLQKKQLEKLDDEDFFDMFTPDVGKEKEKEVDKNLNFDISQLTKKERHALFEKESPEFNGIMQDFQTKMSEVTDVLQPVIDLFNDGKLPVGSAALDYVLTKYKLTLT